MTFFLFLLNFMIGYFFGYLKGNRDGIRDAVLRNEVEQGISGAMNRWRDERR